MRRLALVLSLALASGPACAALEPSLPAATPDAIAVTVATSSAAPVEGSLDVDLPALNPVAVPIASADPEQPPRAYPLAGGRLLIHDAHRDRIALYEPDTGAQTELGEAMLVAVPRLGWLIVPRRTPWQYCDIDPNAAALRVLWQEPTDVAQFMSVVQLAGNDRGAPLFVVTRLRIAPGTVTAVPEPGLRLVRVRGPGRSDVRDLPLPAGLTVPSSDAVRGARLLLLRSAPASSAAEALHADALLLDLEPGTLRSLGRASGDWTLGTAMPHPYIALRWSDHDGQARDHGWAEGCVNVVAVADARLVACVPTVGPGWGTGLPPS